MTTTTNTDIYTLSLHDALPIFERRRPQDHSAGAHAAFEHRRHRAVELRQHLGILHRRDLPVLVDPDRREVAAARRDRKSTRLNSSHSQISYAVFCLKKKNKQL